MKGTGTGEKEMCRIFPHGCSVQTVDFKEFVRWSDEWVCIKVGGRGGRGGCLLSVGWIDKKGKERKKGEGKKGEGGREEICC